MPPEGRKTVKKNTKKVFQCVCVSLFAFFFATGCFSAKRAAPGGRTAEEEEEGEEEEDKKINKLESTWPKAGGSCRSFLPLARPPSYAVAIRGP